MRTVLLVGAALLLLSRPGMAQQLDAAIAAPPLPATPLPATPLPATPLRATPLRAAPLRAAPQGATLQVAPSAAASSPAAPLTPVQLDAGSGRVLTLGSAVANVFVADPKVAEVRPASTTTLFVFGTAPGRTTLAAMDAGGHLVGQFDLIVRPSGYGAALAGEAMGRAMPGSDVHVETTGAGLAVTGQVATAAEAERVMNIARAYATEKQVVDNRLTVAAATQVSLRVRIAEMSRSVSRELGLNWVALQGLGKYAQIGLATSNLVTATASVPAAAAAAYAIGNTGFDGVIEALAQDNLVHMLAEPTLTTMSGEPASFLVGGEFPIPVAGENNTITVAFKQYGVKLAFVPTVIDGGRINIHVQPEVSQLTNQGAVQVSTGSSAISIPGVTMRRADTTVEVGSGDSFAIAGLLQENVTDAVSAVPLLGELPIIGPLFRSDSFQRNESELVIIVTPFIVRPVRDPSALHTPDENFAPPTDLERLLLLRQTGQTADARPPHIPGAAGFIVQ